MIVNVIVFTISKPLPNCAPMRAVRSNLLENIKEAVAQLKRHLQIRTLELKMSLFIPKNMSQPHC